MPEPWWIACDHSGDKLIECRADNPFEVKRIWLRQFQRRRVLVNAIIYYHGLSGFDEVMQMVGLLRR